MKSTTEEILEELEIKYFNLNWYANLTEEEMENFETNKKVAEVARQYPIDLEDMEKPVHSKWQLGFNAGMLAAARLIQTAEYQTIEEAVKNFPDLDT